MTAPIPTLELAQDVAGQSLGAAPCSACGGDGIETCDNPDHGFIAAVGGEIARLGCPCCGHDLRHKMRGPCPECNGTGRIVTRRVYYGWVTVEGDEALPKKVDERTEIIFGNIQWRDEDRWCRITVEIYDKNSNAPTKQTCPECRRSMRAWALDFRHPSTPEDLREGCLEMAKLWRDRPCRHPLNARGERPPPAETVERTKHSRTAARR